jgi:hypothetical protein
MQIRRSEDTRSADTWEQLFFDLFDKDRHFFHPLFGRIPVSIVPLFLALNSRPARIASTKSEYEQIEVVFPLAFWNYC